MNTNDDLACVQGSCSHPSANPHDAALAAARLVHGRRVGRFSLGSVIATMLLAALPIFAHHSTAGIDGSKTVSVKGTLKMFAWSAPHAQVIVIHKNEKGEEEEIGVSTVAPAVLLRQGFKPKDFRRGDQVELFYHPARDGSPGGIMVKLIGADGRTLMGGGLEP